MCVFYGNIFLMFDNNALSLDNLKMIKSICIMSLIFFNLSFFSLEAKERVIVLGGSDEIPSGVISQFMEWANGKESKILIIPWATTGTEYAQVIQKQLEPLAGENSFTNAPAFPMNADMKALFLKQLDEATGVYLTGGDQERILKTIEDKDIRSAMSKKFKSGTPFVGTSAGTAIMSGIAIIAEDEGPKGEPVLVTGNGLCFLPPHVIVDQHFVVRNRELRLRLLVKATPGTIGVGVDEPTGFIVEDGIGKVSGPGSVVIIIGDDKKVLTDGQTINLNSL
jgi:cyanophycinase